MKYKIPSPSTPTQKPITNSILRIDDNGEIWSIPFDPDNTDYQQYLKWVAEGNTPLPADEQGAE
jgi:hypothetical protein